MTHKEHTPVPRRIGRYEILLPIASGGMGTVYLAKSRGLGGFERLVALKVMHPHLREEKEFAHDLVEEAKLAGRIQHPNVVQVLDVGDDPFGVYLVMDYVEGDSLAGLLRARRDDSDEVTIPARVGLKILVDGLLGLHAAHELLDEAGAPLGLVHRDFSPQNILVGLDGQSRLTDFGVAKASSRLTFTRTGLVKGKVHYMSPEQARSEPLDRRSDVWAAGVIAWEMLAARRLYRDRSETAVLLQLVSKLPPRLRRVQPTLARELEEAVAHALSIAPNGRWPTAKELAEALRHGADALGGLASSEEVAAYVKETSEEMLARRRQQLRDVIKLREELENIERQADRDTRRSDESAARAVEIAEDSAVTEPVTALPGELPGDVTGTPQAIDVRDRRAGRSWRSYALALVAATLVGGVLIYRELTPPETATAPAPVASVAVESEEPLAATSASATPAPLEIVVSSDAEVRELWVGDRRVILAPPSRAFQIKLAESESRAELVAVSSDGRRARAAIAPGTARVDLVFPARTPLKPAPRRAAPLASSPYER